MTLWFIALGRGGPRRISPTIRACSRPSILPMRSRFLATHGYDRAGDARRRIPRRHRRRGALRRSRPFRAQADPDGLALFRAAGARPQLFRSRRAGAGRPDGDRQPLLPPGAVMGALSHDRARHRRHDHREPGRDHRRLLADQPGGAARPPAPPPDQAHVGDAGRPDLHSAHQWAAACRRAPACRAVPSSNGLPRLMAWRSPAPCWSMG